MTLTTVIEILEDYVKTTGFIPHEDFGDAIKLAIEAVKRCQLQRKFPNNVIWETLPGETKED